MFKLLPMATVLFLFFGLSSQGFSANWEEFRNQLKPNLTEEEAIREFKKLANHAGIENYEVLQVTNQTCGIPRTVRKMQCTVSKLILKTDEKSSTKREVISLSTKEKPKDLGQFLYDEFVNRYAWYGSWNNYKVTLFPLESANLELIFSSQWGALLPKSMDADIGLMRIKIPKIYGIFFTIH